MKEILNLLDRSKQLRRELQEVSSELCYAIEKSNLSLEQALSIGLAKLNFPAPPGFVRMLKDKHKMQKQENSPIAVR